MNELHIHSQKLRNGCKFHFRSLDSGASDTFQYRNLFVLEDFWNPIRAMCTSACHDLLATATTISCRIAVPLCRGPLLHHMQDEECPAMPQKRIHAMQVVLSLFDLGQLAAVVILIAELVVLVDEVS